MATRVTRKFGISGLPWITEEGTLDLSLFPIDSVLKQALSPDDQQFRSGCTLLGSMSHSGRAAAGVFLLGLLGQYPQNYARLSVIAEALAGFPTPATVDALTGELRRVKGSSATRGYLRRVLATLERFPAALVEARIEELASDPRVGARFRQRLRAMALGSLGE